jgi:hypothetical protein
VERGGGESMEGEMWLDNEVRRTVRVNARRGEWNKA